MTALSADTVRLRRAERHAIEGTGTVATGATVYAGSLLAHVESTGRIKVAPPTAATGLTFVGVAKTAGTAGVQIEYEFNHIEKIAKAAALTTAHMSCNVTAADDNTVTTASAVTAALRLFVGKLVEIEGSNGWIHIRVDAEKSDP